MMRYLPQSMISGLLTICIAVGLMFPGGLEAADRIRKPVVAGLWYPSERIALLEMLAELDRRATTYLRWVRALDPQAGPPALERRALVVEASRFEVLLNDPAVTTAETDQAIEELRAIRMRIHAIDQQVGQEKDGQD